MEEKDKVFGIYKYPWAREGMLARCVKTDMPERYHVGKAYPIVSNLSYLRIEVDGSPYLGLGTIWEPVEKFSEKSLEEIL